MPKISLIIPVYNVERYLRECLDSAVGQTLQDIEIIVVNDASPDNSQQIIADYAARDARIVALAHEHNRGLGAARNTGLERSRGEYIMFLDSDDTMEPNSCELLYNKICEHQADIVACAFRRTDESGTRTLKIEHADDRQPEKVLTRLQPLASFFAGDLPSSSWNKIYRAELWHKNHLRFPPSILMEDEYIIVDILFVCSKLVHISTPLYNYRERSGSIMNSPVTKKAIDGNLIALAHHKEFIVSNTKYQDLHDICRKNIIFQMMILYRKICLHPYKYRHIIQRAYPDPVLLEYWLDSANRHNLLQEACEVITQTFRDLLLNAYSDKTLLKLLGQKIGIYPVYRYIKNKLTKQSLQ